MQNQIIELLTESDIERMEGIDNDLKLVVELCGFDVAKALLRSMPGMNVYVPQHSSRSMDWFMRRIVREMDARGMKTKRIALALGKSEGWVYDKLRK